MKPLAMVTKTPSIATHLGFERLNGSLGSINLSYTRPQSTSTEISQQKPTKGAGQIRVSKYDYDEWNMGLNGDYNFAVGDGDLKLVGLYRTKQRAIQQQVHTLISDSEYIRATGNNSLNIENGKVIKAEYSWSTHTNTDWLLSAETAYNSLEKQSYRLIQETNSIHIKEIPNTSTQDMIEENRSLLALSLGHPLSPKISVRSAVSGEVSHISQTGTGTANRTLFYPEGYVALNYSFSKSARLESRVQRKVKPYNFYNFFSYRDLTDASDNATNTGVMPEKTWILSLDLQKKFENFGNSKVKIYGEFAEDIVTQIPVGKNADATGNIDHAERFGAELSGTMKLSPIGLTGLKFNYFLAAKQSKMIDPITLETRQIGGEKKSDANFSLQYDIPNSDWAISGLVQKTRWATNPRISQDQRKYANAPYTQIALEDKNFFGMKATLSINNLTDQTEILYKAIYPNRRLAPLSKTEYRSRNRGASLHFSLSGTF